MFQNSFKKALKLLFFNIWWILYLVVVFLTRFNHDIIIISSFLIFSFTFTYLKSIFGKKSKYKKFAIRRKIALVWLVLLDAIYRYAINIALLRMISIIIVMYIAFSILSILIFWKVGKITLEREKEDDILNPNKPEIFKILIKTPSWYKVLPFNLGNIHISLKYEVEDHRKEVFEMYITNKKDVEIKLDFQFKGIFKTGVKEIEFIDTLGMFKIKKKYDLEEIIVYPEYGKAKKKSHAVIDGEVDMITQLVKKGSRFDKKEYESGDNLKHVDWKLYARNGKLFLKEEELNSFEGGRVIFYDNRKFFNGHLHKYVDTKQTEILLSILNVLKLQKEDFNVIYFDDEKGIKKQEKKQFNRQKIELQNSFIPFVEHYNRKYFKDISDILKNSVKSDELVIVSSMFDEDIQRLVIPFSGIFSKIRFIYISTVKGRDKNIMDINVVAKKYSMELYVIELTEAIHQHLKGVLASE